MTFKIICINGLFVESDEQTEDFLGDLALGCDYLFSTYTVIRDGQVTQQEVLTHD